MSENGNTEVKEVKPFEMADMNEAGGVAYCQIRRVRDTEDGGSEVLEVNLTGRGHDCVEAMKNLLNGLHYAVGAGFSIYRRLDKGVAVPTGLPKGDATPGATPGTVPPPDGNMTMTPTDGGGIIIANKINIVPRADGRVSIEFYGAGHKYYDLMRICTPEQAVELLRPVGGFTVEHMGKAQVYDKGVNLEIKWLPSERLNSAGNPYKNIFSIRNLNG